MVFSVIQTDKKKKLNCHIVRLKEPIEQTLIYFKGLMLDKCQTYFLSFYSTELIFMS
jgi:hypothetical protein